MDRLYQATVAVPAGTPILTPVTQTLALEDAQLISIRILIPDGHAGLTGIRISQAGQEIIPWSNDDWLISNNEIVDVTVNEQITRSGVDITCYNTDAFDHIFWVRVLIGDLTNTTASISNTPPPLPADILSSP